MRGQQTQYLMLIQAKPFVEYEAGAVYGWKIDGCSHGTKRIL